MATLFENFRSVFEPLLAAIAVVFGASFWQWRAGKSEVDKAVINADLDHHKRLDDLQDKLNKLFEDKLEMVHRIATLEAELDAALDRIAEFKHDTNNSS